MNLSNEQKSDLKKAIIAGTCAGVISGLVKLGWENILPPRTKERDATNPPQKLMQQMGIPESWTHATYTYSGQKLPWVSYLVHFGFSTSFAIIYEVLAQYKPFIRMGHGTIFGLAIWVAFHLGIMPMMKTVPSAKDQPSEEHISEALGHIAWMWTNDVVGEELLRRLTSKD
jgi:Predicted periplasmic/secreted protein